MLRKAIGPEFCGEKTYAVVEVLGAQHRISPYRQTCVLILFLSDLSISLHQLVVSGYRSDSNISAYHAAIYNDRYLHTLRYNIGRASEKPYHNPTGTLRQRAPPGPLVVAIHLAACRLPEDQCHV